MFTKNLGNYIKNNRFENEYKNLGKIGKGGFGEVIHVKHNIDGQEYALKCIKMKISHIKGNIEKEVARVAKEAKYMARLSHQNIIRYYNSWIELKEKKSQSERKQKKKNKALNEEKNLTNCSNNLSLNSWSQVNSNLNAEKQAKPLPQADDSVLLFENDTQQPPSQQQQPPVELRKPRSQNEEQNIKEKKIQVSVSASQKEEERKYDEWFNYSHIYFYIQMELCQNTLENYLEQRNSKFNQMNQQKDERTGGDSFTKQMYLEAVQLLKQLLEGTSHIHQEYMMVHRDLKPNNIFLTANNTVKIGDFGLVKIIDKLLLGRKLSVEQRTSDSSLNASISDNLAANRLDQCKSQKKNPELDPLDILDEEEMQEEDVVRERCGTINYASPEQLDANLELFDHRSDIFSLGVILLQLFCPTYSKMELYKLFEKSKNGQSLLENVLFQDKEINDLILKCISKDPTQRPSLNDIKLIVQQKEEWINNYLQQTDVCSFQAQFSQEDEDEESTTQKQLGGTERKWQKKFCKIIRKTMYIYKSEAHKKAENSIQLSLSKINFIQDSQQLEIMHPQMIKFTLRFDEPNIQELKKILLQIQKLITINYVGSNNCRRSMKEQFTSSSERLAHQ